MLPLPGANTEQENPELGDNCVTPMTQHRSRRGEEPGTAVILGMQAAAQRWGCSVSTPWKYVLLQMFLCVVFYPCIVIVEGKFWLWCCNWPFSPGLLQMIVLWLSDSEALSGAPSCYRTTTNTWFCFCFSRAHQVCQAYQDPLAREALE